MKYALLIGCICAFGAVFWLTFVGEAASLEIGAAYMAASIVTLALARLEKAWAGALKWAWVALSLVMIFAIVTGPLDYFTIA